MKKNSLNLRKSPMTYLLVGLVGLLFIALIVLISNITHKEENDLIYFVSKTSSENSTFWHSVERGVKVAADELGVNLMFVGPDREIDLEDQIQLVREGIAKKPLAIILAASDYNKLAEVSQEVVDSGIIFLTVDSDVNIQEGHSFIATDNQQAARLLGTKLGQSIDGEGSVSIISHLEGATSAIDREKGFIEGIKQFNHISLNEDIYYSSNDKDKAYAITQDLIKDNPELTGIFGTNEATLIGIAEAVEDLDMAMDIKVVGFDISEEAAAYVEKDVIQMIIVQRPFNMGYLSVQEAYRQAKGGKGVEFISVDTVLVDKENMFNEENQRFIIPFLE